MTTLTPALTRTDNTRMTMDQLAALDAEYRRHLREATIRELRRGIETRRAQAGRTDIMERRLHQLLNEGAA